MTAAERRTRWLAWIFFVPATVGTVALVSLLAGGELTWFGSERAAWSIGLDVLGYYAFAVVGAVLAIKRPRNPVGWLLLYIGASLAGGAAADQYAAYAYARAAGEPVGILGYIAEGLNWGWAAAFAALPFALLLFPNGRPPSDRWRWLGYASGISGAVVIGVVATTVVRDISRTVRMDAAPEGALAVVGAAAVFALTGCVLAAAVSLIVRFRRAVAMERQQLRWLAAAMIVLIATFLAGGLEPHVPALVGVVIEAAGGIAFIGVPVAVGVAVMRYRLYDLGRLVNRTVGYVAVIAILAVAYVGIVMSLQLVLSPITSGGELSVAASTLAVAVLFRPVRDRVRRRVESRFNRARYDAARTVEDFGRRLRDAVELTPLLSDLEQVAKTTLQPSALSVWMPEQTAIAGGVSTGSPRSFGPRSDPRR
jgi:hypothetical protein